MVLIFDLDNTLINRDKAYYAWLEKLLYSRKLTAMDWQEIYVKDDSAYCGREEFYTWLAQRFELPDTPEFFMGKCAVELHQFVEKESQVIALLDRLSVAYEIGIGTNGSVLNQMSKLKAAGVLEIVEEDRVFISQALKVKKPQESFFRSIELAFTGDAEFWMIGDDPVNDIQGARNAGWKTVWISHERQIQVDADCVIEDLTKLERLLITDMI